LNVPDIQAQSLPGGTPPPLPTLQGMTALPGPLTNLVSPAAPMLPGKRELIKKVVLFISCWLLGLLTQVHRSEQLKPQLHCCKPIPVAVLPYLCFPDHDVLLTCISVAKIQSKIFSRIEIMILFQQS
jgi:hypothetical protein